MKKNTLQDAIAIAREKGGKCLSVIYKNAHTKMLWQCKGGHKWQAPYNAVQQNHWCPKCCRKNNKNKKSIQDCKKLARTKGGRCLSQTYTNNASKLLWECEVGHLWYATYSNVKKKTWCPKCNIISRRKKVEDYVALAKSNGGRYISGDVIRTDNKVLWECANKHRWKASYHKIYLGRWCPKCLYSNKQTQLVKILEDIFLEKAMVNIRPDWMKNPKTKRNLEIDIYFPNIKIAVEYNGEQHYRLISFSKNVSGNEKLKNTKARDKLKKKLIKSNPDKIKNFIIFTYRNKIKTKNVEDILRKKGII